MKKILKFNSPPLVFQPKQFLTVVNFGNQELTHLTMFNKSNPLKLENAYGSFLYLRNIMIKSWWRGWQAQVAPPKSSKVQWMCLESLKGHASFIYSTYIIFSFFNKFFFIFIYIILPVLVGILPQIQNTYITKRKIRNIEVINYYLLLLRKLFFFYPSG